MACGEEFANGENVTFMFADNIIEDELDFKDFKEGARIHLKEVPDPERFGIAEIKDEKIISIEEKPKEPKSNLCITGIYIYDKNVFDYIKTLTPSSRGELEVTDLNNIYFNKGQLDYKILKGVWIDAGTFDAMLEASNFVKNK